MRTLDIFSGELIPFVFQLPPDQFNILITVVTAALVDYFGNEWKGKRGMYTEPFAMTQEAVEQYGFLPSIVERKYVHFLIIWF